MTGTTARPRKNRERGIDYPVTPWLDLARKIEDDCNMVIPSLRLRAIGLIKLITVLSRQKEFLTLECWCHAEAGECLYGWMHFSPRVQYLQEQTWSDFNHRWVGSLLVAGLKHGGRLQLRTNKKKETAEVTLGDGCILQWEGALQPKYHPDEDIVPLMYYSIRDKKIGSDELPYELH